MSKVKMLHETEAKTCSNTGSKQVPCKMTGALSPLKVPFILLEKASHENTLKWRCLKMSKIDMLHETEAKTCSNTGSKQVPCKMKGALNPLKVSFILLEKHRMKNH